MEKKSNVKSYSVSKLAAGENGRQFKVSLISVGFLRAMGGNQSNRYVPDYTLKDAVEDGLFNSLAVFVDHAGWFEYPAVNNLVARTADSSWDEELQAVVATVEFYERPLADAMVNIFDSMLDDDDAPDIRFSLVFWGAYGEREKVDDPLVLDSITHVESADIVFEPAADGARVLEALSVHWNKQNSANSHELARQMVGSETFLCQGENSMDLTKMKLSALVALALGMGLDPEGLSKKDLIELIENSPIDGEAVPEVNAETQAEPVVQQNEILAAVDTRVNEAIEPVTVALASINERLSSRTEDGTVQIGGTPPRSPNSWRNLKAQRELC